LRDDLRHQPMRASRPMVMGSVRWPRPLAGFRARFIPTLAGRLGEEGGAEGPQKTSVFASNRLFPGAAQHAVMRRRAGIVANSEAEVPSL
jgi:hypothetical protein